MKFEWDEDKSRSNETKHGIDFSTATQLWKDYARVEIQTDFPNEARDVLIGDINGKLWTAIFTWRNDIVRIISVRRARKKEAKLYETKESR